MEQHELTAALVLPALVLHEPRIGEPESALSPGMAAPRFEAEPRNVPDTSQSGGSVYAPSPTPWLYDWTDAGMTVSRATFNGVLAGGAGRPVSVKDFGAKGDGATDDGAAFAAFLTAIAGGGAGVVPAGTYNIGRALTQAVSGSVSFVGAGSGVTMLNFTAATDGLTFSLAPTATVHIEGMTISRAVATPVYANTGLVITTPSPQGVRPALSTIRDVFVMGNVARTTAWAIGISINNTSTLSMDHVYVNMPNADGTFGTSIGVALAGLSASSYLVEVALNDVSTLGGSIGLELGDWIQGVYVDNSRFISNDFGIRWAGVAGQADLFVAVANSHVNSGSRGIQSIVASALQIINTYVLHFPIASTSADWAGFEFQTMDSGLVSNNNIYGNGTSSAVPEYGVRLIGSNTSTIIGNHINNPKTAGIYLGSGTNATVAANNLGSAFAAGVPLVQDVTGNTSNLQMGNQRDGVADFNVNGPRIAGWGTSTGGVRGAVTGASTLPQVAAALAQLLTDLTTHGMIGV